MDAGSAHKGKSLVTMLALSFLAYHFYRLIGWFVEEFILPFSANFGRDAGLSLAILSAFVGVKNCSVKEVEIWKEENVSPNMIWVILTWSRMGGEKGKEQAAMGQIVPPDVPRKYILNASNEIRVYETHEGFNELMQRWITRLERWRREWAKLEALVN
ncbi:7250_t:CDS:2 [Paraglomus occultum]|uniref:7250_t:CDS:1 n=1 Tax=Paraglomus occultum TaxID=144539 RepID=A0A9N9AZL8_9GLOM|nr:7250_t:CDS:2 [Paraglomus occultum]